jgi:mannose-6-phosphate isomerase-like protein (cupin superfamily)
MPNFTHKNLKQDVVDAAVEYGLSPQIESRFGRKHLDSRELGVSYFRYGSGFRAPFGHTHGSEEEAYVVISGSGRIKLDDEIVELRQWDVVRVAPEVMRALEGGPEGMEVIAVGGSKAEGDQGNLVQGWWED